MKTNTNNTGDFNPNNEKDQKHLKPCQVRADGDNFMEGIYYFHSWMPFNTHDKPMGIIEGPNGKLYPLAYQHFQFID